MSTEVFTKDQQETLLALLMERYHNEDLALAALRAVSNGSWKA